MKEKEIEDPRHYNINWKGEQTIQTYEYINSWQMGYAEGNIVKYVSRHKYKDNPLKDLKKARWYLNQLIAELEENNAKD